MRRIWRRSVAVAALLTATTTLGQARAEPSGGEEALAETLYRQGRQLMTEGRLDQACAKFAESQRLDPASGTLLNLAACHEAKHMFASAWLEYTEATTWARRDQRADRVAYAEERIHALEPKLSHLTVLVDPGADVSELHIEVDGIPLRGAARGVAIPVDPGVHQIDVRAPSRQPWSQRVSFEEAPTNVTVTIPTLEPVPMAAPVSTVVAAPPSAPTAEPRRPIPSAVYVAGGVTLGAAVASSVTGIWFLTKKTQYETSADDGDYRAAQTAGIVNAVFWMATAIGAGTTAYLYFSRPTEVANQGRKETLRGGWSIAPWSDGTGMSLRWRQ
jgi:hypothetical protein